MGRRFTLAAAIALALHVTAASSSPLGPEGAPGQRHSGKFIWYDLATEDVESARAFYGAVFGWKFREVPGAPASYTLIENSSGKVGGLFRQARPPGATVGARWLSLMSVEDVEKAATMVKARGGEVLLAPRAVAGRGTHAVFRDPEGAVFGVLANEGGDPPDSPVDDGDVFWLDLFAHDPAKAAAFYAALGGHAVEAGEIAGRKRTQLSTQGIARAGIARLPANADKPGWLPYVLVSDVPATVARARAAGGKVVLAPRGDLLDGQLAVIADPFGGLTGIVNWVGP